MSDNAKILLIGLMILIGFLSFLGGLITYATITHGEDTQARNMRVALCQSIPNADQKTLCMEHS